MKKKLTKSKGVSSHKKKKRSKNNLSRKVSKKRSSRKKQRTIEKQRRIIANQNVIISKQNKTLKKQRKNRSKRLSGGGGVRSKKKNVTRSQKQRERRRRLKREAKQEEQLRQQGDAEVAPSFGLDIPEGIFDLPDEPEEPETEIDTDEELEREFQLTDHLLDETGSEESDPEESDPEGLTRTSSTVTQYSSPSLDQETGEFVDEVARASSEEQEQQDERKNLAKKRWKGAISSHVDAIGIEKDKEERRNRARDRQREQEIERENIRKSKEQEEEEEEEEEVPRTGQYVEEEEEEEEPRTGQYVEEEEEEEEEEVPRTGQYVVDEEPRYLQEEQLKISDRGPQDEGYETDETIGYDYNVKDTEEEDFAPGTFPQPFGLTSRGVSQTDQIAPSNKLDVPQKSKIISESNQPTLGQKSKSFFKKVRSVLSGPEYEQLMNQSSLEQRNLYMSYLNEYFTDMEEGEDLETIKEKYMRFIESYYDQALKNDKLLLEKLKKV